MASLWHLLFPPAAEVTALGHPGKNGAALGVSNVRKEEEDFASSAVAPAAAGSTDAAQPEACCGSSPSQHSACSCQPDDAAETRGQPSCCSNKQESTGEAAELSGVQSPPASQGTVLYASQKGTAAFYAHQLASAAASVGMSLTVTDVAQYEVEQMWKEQCVILVLSTYEDGNPPSSAG